MKALALIFTFLSLQIAYGQQAHSLPEVKDFGSNPGNLKMYLHTPPPADTRPIPLVIVLHGCGENAESAARLTGWNKLADQHAFAVLYPQQKIVNNPQACFNWFLRHDQVKGQGECESVFQMITWVRQHYRIDSTRICITGLSAGGAMTTVMLATHPDLFRAGAVFAGAAYRSGSQETGGLSGMVRDQPVSRTALVHQVKAQNPDYTGPYPALILYQGMQDPISGPANAVHLVNQWTGIQHTDTIPDRIEPAFRNIPDICRSEYSDSLGKPVVIVYKVDHLGHRLLVNPGDAADEGGQTGIFGIDIGFHSTYQTALDFGLLKAP